MMNTRRSRWKMSFDILSQRLLWCWLPPWSFVKANRTYLAELTRNVNVGWDWRTAPLGSLKYSHCLSLCFTHWWCLGCPVGHDGWLQMSCTLLTLIIPCTLSKCSALMVRTHAHLLTHRMVECSVFIPPPVDCLSVRGTWLCSVAAAALSSLCKFHPC